MNPSRQIASSVPPPFLGEGESFADISLDPRARAILKAIVREYIRQGEPVGSRTLAKITDLRLSPATFRNVMSDLEEMGLLSSLHTSSGRIPSVRGMRFFVDSLLAIRPPDARLIRRLRDGLKTDSAGDLLGSAARVMSNLTRFAGFVATPPREAASIRRLEFVQLSERRLLIVMVTSTGEVLNRVIPAPGDFSAADLAQASEYFNRRLRDSTFEEARRRLQTQMHRIRRRLSGLLARTLETMAEESPPSGDDFQVVGEGNLLAHESLSMNMTKLRDLFSLFERKKDLLKLLETGRQAENVRIFIGSECGVPALSECSVILSPYSVDRRSLGVIGVIGPKRMRYGSVIPAVEVTAKLVGAALEKIRMEL